MGDDERDEPPPDFHALVERELRIADNLTWSEKLYAAIFGPNGSLGIEGRRQKYLPMRRSR